MKGKIKAVILCGGIGKRMFPISKDKSLLKFCGVPLIVHQIIKAKQAGLSQFVIITNKLNHALICTALSALKDISLNYVVQKKPRGMADALLTASSTIGENPFFLVSSNDIFDTSAYTFILKEYKKLSRYIAYIMAVHVTGYFPGGYLIISTEGAINKIIEKPDINNIPSTTVNLVLHLHTKPSLLFDYLKNIKSEADDSYERALNKMITSKYKLKAVIYKGDWHMIKYPWHILDVMDYFSHSLQGKISDKAIISNKATIEGEVILEDGVQILEGAIIRGPSYIGQNTIIGNNSLIRNSFIGNNNVIGYNTEIKHSYIENDCWFHSNYIGDSVISENCSFGAGSIIANFRLDEKVINNHIQEPKIMTGHDKLGAFLGSNNRIGINTSIMPGIRIGSNCVIGPHVCLNQHIESNTTVIEDRKYISLHRNRGKISNIKRNELYKKLVK